jgi:glycosyltransferase involved in cell wall biosynthesis
MNLLICNERFCFRFGLDRVLILLARHLSELGHTVSIMGARWDQDVVSGIARQLIHLPSDNANYLDWGESTAAWLERTWPKHFRTGPVPDVILVGGWPFHAALPFFRSTGAKVIYLDCGAVPLRGYSGHALAVQEKLRTLRRQYLRHASSIIAISDFLARTQSGPDTDHEVPVFSVLLGADHLHMPTWRADAIQSEDPRRASRAWLDAPELRTKRKILSLGRWEPNCYKNSEAAFDFMEELMRSVPDAVLLVLESPSGVAIPHSLRDVVFPIGFPGDAELLEIMRRADLAISLSLWEGFNLPLAEMQWEGRPVLAFDCAAHPEVIAHPWYLCKDVEEMASKASAILQGGLTPAKDKRRRGLPRVFQLEPNLPRLPHTVAGPERTTWQPQPIDATTALLL